MLKEVGMESVHSQNDHNPEVEARTEDIVAVSDSELEETGTTSPEPSEQRWVEKHRSKRDKQLSVESMNDTGQQESSVGPDHMLNSVDGGSSHFKTIGSKDTSGQPDHSMAHKGSSASGGISMDSGACSDGHQNPPLLEDTADCLEHTERPEDISGQQHNTISSKEGCHQEDQATGVKEISKQPGYSPESEEIHDQTDNTSKSTVTSHQLKNTKEYDKINDQKNMAREHEETTDQPHNTMEREETTDQPHNTTVWVETTDQPHSTTEREEITGQPHNTMVREENIGQPDNTTEREEITDQPDKTTEREEITDQPDNTTEREEITDQPDNTTEREEITDQPHNTTERDEITDQPDNTTEREEITDQPDNTTEREEITDQTYTVTESKGIDNQAGINEESKEPSDKVYHTTESEDCNYPDRTTMSTMETFEVSVQSVMVRETTKKSDQPEITLDSEENSDKPDHLMGPKRICEESEKTEMSFEIGDHAADTTESQKTGNQVDDRSEAREHGDQSVIVAATKGTSEQSEKGILSMEISDHGALQIQQCSLLDQSSENIESKVVNNQSEETERSKNISEEPATTMDSREMSDEAGTTNGTGNSDRLPNTVEVFGSNSEAITVVNSAESIDKSNSTNDPISVRIDDPIYNVNSKDLNILSCTEVRPTESCQGSPNNTFNRDSQDMCHIDAPSKLAYNGFPNHTDPLESNDPEILGVLVPGLTNAGTIWFHNIEMNEASATSPHSNGPPEACDQLHSNREAAEAKDKPNERIDHQGPRILHDHNPEDESNIQHSTAERSPQVESPHQPYRRDSEAQTALDTEIERQFAILLESNTINTPQTNPWGMSLDVTLPAAFVGIKGMESDPLGQDGETTYLYELKNDHSMSSTEASVTQDAMLAHCVTGKPSSELWEIPSQCLPPDQHFVEDDSRAPSLGASPPSNSHHIDLDPKACSGSVGLDTVRCPIEWTQHPDATPEISNISIPSALLLQNGPSGVVEEAVLFEDVSTMDYRSSFHFSDVDDSMWVSDGPRDIVFTPYGQDDTVSPSLQVEHVHDATESKAPAIGDQCENKLQKDISQTPKSPSPKYFRRPQPDMEGVPTKDDLVEEEESIPGSEHPTFTSDTNDEEPAYEPAYDTLLVERCRYAEDVPDGNPTLVNPLASEDEHPLQRASHEQAFPEGLQAPVCLRVQQAEPDSSLNMNLGDVFPLASGTDPALPNEELISVSWPIDPLVGGFNEVEEIGGGRYVGEGRPEAHEVPVRIHPYGFKVDFTKFHSPVPTQLHGADKDVQEPPAASNPDFDKAGYEVHAAAEVVDNLSLGEDSTVDTSSGWESDLSITCTSSPPIKRQTPRPINFYNPFMWHEHSRPPRSFSEEVTAEPKDDHARLCSPVNPLVLLNSLPVGSLDDGTVLGAETSPIPDLSPASENVFLSPQVRFAPVTVIAGTAEPKTQSNWVPTWKVPDDSVLQVLTRKIGSPKLSRRAHKVYRTSGGSDASEIRHRHSTPFLVSHIHLEEEKVPGETAVREPDRLPSLTPKLFKTAPLPSHTKVLFKQVAVSEDAHPNAEEDLQSTAQSTCEAALPVQGMDYSTSDPVQLRKRQELFTSSNILRRHSKLVNSSRQLYQEYSDEALNQAIERQKRGETLLEDPEPSSPRLRRKLMSSPDSYLQRLSVSSSAALWQDIPMIRGTSALLSMTREEQKLQEAKFELIMSEASYLRSLNIAVDHFQHSPDLQTLLSNQERQWLFSRLQEVRDVSSNFLYDLEEKFEDNMYTFNVCDVVLSHAADFRKVYLPYVTNQSYQDQTYQRLLSGNPRFQQVLVKLESDPVCQRLSLKSFLILPFQRITRLKLLVQNILKRTRPGSREEAPATQAYSLLEKLIKDCNENVQRMRSTEELIYLSQKIEFECKIFPLISQSRRLVKQGELLELEWSTPLSFKWKVITRPIYLHLFNDCLLLSRRREGARFLVFDHARASKVHGEKCEMKMHGNSKNIFRLILQENNQGRKVEFLLRTETQSEKLRWIAALAHHKTKPDFLQCHDNPQVQCLKSYKAREHDELSLEKADVIMVTQQSKDGWMEGTRLSDGEHGWFPVENVEDISNKHVRLRNLKEEQRVQHARAKLIPPHHLR